MTQKVKIKPPSELLIVCTVPGYYGETINDVVDYVIQLQDQILECRARDIKRNEWYDAGGKPALQ